MPLMTCPECSNQVSDKAASCPKCGHPLAVAGGHSNLTPPTGGPSAQVETSYYADNKGVRITNSRAILGNQTYSMANVSSVGAAVIPAKRAGGVLMLIIGLIGVAVGMSSQPGGGTGFMAMVAFGGLLWLILNKDQYAVRITAAGGETNALVSTDKAYVDSIVQGFNEAIVRRG